MEKKTRIVRNTFSQIFARSITIIISLLTTAILTRSLGSESFGNYIFITSFVLLFVGLTDFGTTTIAVREASIFKENRKEIFGNMIGFRLFLSFFVFLFLNLLVLVLPQFEGLKVPTLLASLVVIVLVLRTSVQAILQVFLRLDLYSVLEILASFFVLIFIALLVLLKIKISLAALMVIWVFSAVISGLFGIYFSKKYINVKILFQKKEIIKILKSAGPLGVYMLVYAVYDRGIDNFFLKSFINSSAVGLYGLAYKVHGNLIYGAAFLMNSLFPILASLKGNSQKIHNIYNKAFTLLLLTGMLVLVFGIILSPLVIKIISGNDYFDSINILRILLFATFFSFLNHLNGYLMISLNEQKMLLFYSLIALAINLIFNYIFIPYYSYWAAAVITVLTEACIFWLSKKYLSRKYSLKISLKELRFNVNLIIKNKFNIFETQSEHEKL